MITLTQTRDYVIMLLIAAVLGLVGGFAAEMLLTHGRKTGAFELPRKLQRGTLLEFGGFGTMLIGAIAAVGSIYFFPPTLQVVVTGTKGASHTIAQYDLTKLIALSIIIGSSGGSFLRAMQARTLALLNEERVQQTANVANQEIDQAGRNISSSVTAAVDAALKQRTPELEALLRRSTEAAPPALQQLVKSAKEGQQPPIEVKGDNEMIALVDRDSHQELLELPQGLAPDEASQQLTDLLDGVRSDAQNVASSSVREALNTAKRAIANAAMPITDVE